MNDDDEQHECEDCDGIFNDEDCHAIHVGFICQDCYHRRAAVAAQKPAVWSPPGPEARCSGCGGLYGTRADDTIRTHSISKSSLHPQLGTTTCIGTGHAPAPE